MITLRITQTAYLVTERMGQCGLYFDTMCEVVPEVVSTTMAAALHLYDARTALIAVVEVLSKPAGFSLSSFYKKVYIPEFKYNCRQIYAVKMFDICCPLS